MLPVLIQHASKLKYLINSNSTSILTGVAVTGTVATAYLAGRASFKAADIIAAKEEQNREDEITVELVTAQKIQLVWKEYLPAVGMGVITVGSVIAAHKISSGKIAALTAAAGISERALQEYKGKVLETIGAKQEEKIRDEIAQDRVLNEPPPTVNGNREVLVAGTGEVLCFDMFSGRYFQSTMEEIKRAENKVNYEVLHFDACSLTHFYDEVGLPPTSFSDSIGWNGNNHLEVKFSTVLSTDSRPCIAIDFSRAPMADYDNKWT